MIPSKRALAKFLNDQGLKLLAAAQRFEEGREALFPQLVEPASVPEKDCPHCRVRLAMIRTLQEQNAFLAERLQSLERLVEATWEFVREDTRVR